jgi:drug/metabolite transporter (DMT)-like permease
MLTVLRTAFLVYVRVLLFLQSMYLGFWAWALFPRRNAPTQFWAPLGLALLFAFLSLAGIAAAILLRRGRRWAAATAILIEALWAAAAAAFGYWTLKEWPIDLHLLGLLTVGGALFLVAVAGLLLRPVRAYAGLVRS